MREVIWVLGAVTALSGCAPTQFFTNNVLDASAVSRSVSARKIATENGVFGLYKINDTNYAVVSGLYQGGDALSELNGALILGDKEAETLRETCRQIIAAYGKPAGEQLEVVEYHLVERAAEVRSFGSAIVYGGMASTTVQAGSYHPVPFRLQYTYLPGAIFGSGKKVSYMLGGMVGEMRLEQVEALLRDLQK